MAPEKIEAIYVRSEFVAQVFIDGDSLKVGILVVNVMSGRWLRVLLDSVVSSA